MRRNLTWIFLLAGCAFQASAQTGIKFIENKNQLAASVDFSARVPGGDMLIEPGAFQYFFLDQQRLHELHERSHTGSESPESVVDEMITGNAIRVKFANANSELTPQAFGKSTEYYNYFLGSDTCRWASKAFAYDGFIYPSLYDGIDLKVYSTGNTLKYDLIVAPGKSTASIALEYSGTQDLSIDNGGDFHVRTQLAELIEKKPVAYQFINGKQVYVPCEYRLKKNKLSFHFPEGYDSCQVLTIDPILIFSTYSGSLADNWGSTATYGERGTLYSAGVTNHFFNNGINIVFTGVFPITSGVFQTAYGGIYDIGILKYDSAGKQLLYASYLGGSGSEIPHSLYMNNKEELIVLGTTSSFNFPTTVNAYSRTFNGGPGVTHVLPYVAGSDIILSRISKDGSQLLASTLLGGSGNDGLNDGDVLTKNYGDQLRGDVVTDEDGDIYVSSVTASPFFPKASSADDVYNGGPTDAIVFRFNESLSTLKFTVFLGGSRQDAAYTIKLDDRKNIYVAGGTFSQNFPVTPGAAQSTLGGGSDGWIAHISNDGDSIYHTTYTGTSDYDQVYFLDLNTAGDVYVYGQTDGNFPVFPSSVYRNENSGQFIQKFNPDLSSIEFSTVVGGSRGTPDISPTAFLINDCNYIYLSGWGGLLNTGYWPLSSTVGLPISEDAIQDETLGSDFYFMVLAEDATQFLYGTYLGGNQSSTHVDGGTSRFDKNSIVYHAVCSGCRGGYSDFPTTPGAWSSQNRSPNCNNVAFKLDLSQLQAKLKVDGFEPGGVNVICIPDQVTFRNESYGGEQFTWDFGDGKVATYEEPIDVTHRYNAPGQYTAWLKLTDYGTCKGKDSMSVVIHVFYSESEVQDDDDLCEDVEYTLHASGGEAYEWRSADGEFQSNLPKPEVVLSDTTVYYVQILEASGCLKRDTVQLNVIPKIVSEFEIKREDNCFAQPSILLKDITENVWSTDQVFFDLGDGHTSDDQEVHYSYEQDGLYTIKLIGIREAGNEICVSEKSVTMHMFTLLVPNVITPGFQEGSNDKFVIQYGEQKGTKPADYGFKVSVLVYNRWGDTVYESSDYQNDWDASGLSAGVYYYDVSVQGHAVCKSWLQVIR